METQQVVSRKFNFDEVISGKESWGKSFAVKKEVDVNKPDTERLKKLGLTGVAKRIDSAEKLAFAYGNYLFIEQDTVDLFNQKLRKDTLREDKDAREFKRLVFLPLGDYQELPPPHVVDALEKATKDDCFDFFEVGKINWIREVKDPILFGRIKGSTDRFFIAQWDDDIRLEDLINVKMEK